MAKEKSYHYHLICGTLMLDAGNDNISSVSLNAILHTEHAYLTAHNLGQAQQALQMNFHKRMEGDPFIAQMKIVDVVLASITHIGFMTPSKFHKAPEGMQLSQSTEQPNEISDPDTIEALFGAADDSEDTSEVLN